MAYHTKIFRRFGANKAVIRVKNKKINIKMGINGETGIEEYLDKIIEIVDSHLVFLNDMIERLYDVKDNYITVRLNNFILLENAYNIYNHLFDDDGIELGGGGIKEGIIKEMELVYNLYIRLEREMSGFTVKLNKNISWAIYFYVIVDYFYYYFYLYIVENKDNIITIIKNIINNNDQNIEINNVIINNQLINFLNGSNDKINKMKRDEYNIIDYINDILHVIDSQIKKLNKITKYIGNKNTYLLNINNLITCRKIVINEFFPYYKFKMSKKVLSKLENFKSDIKERYIIENHVKYAYNLLVK